MGFEKWKNIVKKTDVPEEEWDELILASSSTTPLGPAIIDNYLQQDGDVIEIDMKDKDRRSIGNFLRALRIAKAKRKLDISFLLRYSRNNEKAYIKRVG